mmetsp:Transcript_16788/g.25126  ORF Transcript_16788/g.25126 Transcript_16788/m.25126 type:complete len:125 (+) Transcript_16788:225-599(+)
MNTVTFLLIDFAKLVSPFFFTVYGIPRDQKLLSLFDFMVLQKLQQFNYVSNPITSISRTLCKPPDSLNYSTVYVKLQCKVRIALTVPLLHVQYSPVYLPHHAAATAAATAATTTAAYYNSLISP